MKQVVLALTLALACPALAHAQADIGLKKAEKLRQGAKENPFIDP